MTEQPPQTDRRAGLSEQVREALSNSPDPAAEAEAVDLILEDEQAGFEQALRRARDKS